MLRRHEYAGERVDDFEGLSRRAPFWAFAMVVFLLSLGGIPPTAGFIGKYFLFAAAVQAGFGWLAVIAVLMSAVSMFYYLRLVVAMYLREGTRSGVRDHLAAAVRGRRLPHRDAGSRHLPDADRSTGRRSSAQSPRAALSPMPDDNDRQRELREQPRSRRRRSA